jgi:hypothetical protein
MTDTTEVPNTNVIPINHPLTREQIRAAIFTDERRKPKSKLITAFGVSFEIRQPSVGAFLASPTDDDEEHTDPVSKIRALHLLVNNSYVPGTEEKVFNQEDYAAFVSMPFSNDFVTVITAFNEISGANPKEKQKN